MSHKKISFHAISYFRLFLAALVLAGGISISLAQPALQASALDDRTYSCGTYGAGNYSENSCDGGVEPPNTGFGVLLQPNNLALLIGSLIMLGAGIGILLRLRRRKT